MSNDQDLLFSENGGIATITFNRPDVLNALTIAMIEELNALLDRVRDEGSARVLLFTGSGRGFCVGSDVRRLDNREGPRDAGLLLETKVNPLIERMRNLPVPIVCAVNGPAAGAGCSIALAADIVVAARSAFFLQAFANIGLVPDAGSTWQLPRLIGRARATGMMMLAERISAEQALAWGMIWQVVDDGELDAAAQALAARLAAGPTRAYALMRQGIAGALEMSLADALALEANHQRSAGTTKDHTEGVAAFLEKRKANFTGE